MIDYMKAAPAPYGGDWVDKTFGSYAAKVKNAKAKETEYGEVLGQIDSESSSEWQKIRTAELMQRMNIQKAEENVGWYNRLAQLSDYQRDSQAARNAAMFDAASRGVGDLYEGWAQNRYDTTSAIPVDTSGFNPAWDNYGNGRYRNEPEW